MRSLIRKPVFAALLILAFLGLAAPIAYAIDRVFLSIDADKSATEIEKDVNQQLQSQGVPATVEARKSHEGIVHVKIESSEPDLGHKLQIGTADPASARTFRVEVDCPGEVGCAELHNAATNEDITNILASDRSDEELAAVIQRHLEEYNVDVTVKDVTVTIRCRR